MTTEADLVVKAPIEIEDDATIFSSQKFLKNDFSVVFGSQRSAKHLVGFEEAKRDGGSTFFSKGLRSNKCSSFTIDQLRFSELQLHGRAKEQDALLTCLKHVGGPSAIACQDSSLESSSIKQLVFISGESGAGKTRFTNTTLIEPVRQMGGIFALGKYDLQLKSEPYLGLVSACEHIFMEIAQPTDANIFPTSSKKLDSFRQDLTDDLGDRIKTLAQLVPSIMTYILKDSDRTGFESLSDSDEFEGGDKAKATLNFVFRGLFRALCKHYGPVVFVLDDLQWADAASLELIEELLSDRDIRSLMFIVLYRSESLGESPLVSKTLQKLKEKTSNDVFALTEITIDNIDVEGVNGIIMDLLSVDSSQATRGLAEICCRRTSGNVFFVLSFLRMLKESGYLDYNFGAMKWMFDLPRIESETVSAINVVALTKKKMGSLNKEYQTILVLASCLGHMFEKKKLIIVAEGELSNVDFIDEFLLFTLKESFLEGPLGGELAQYRWTHDSIREAAGCLMTEEVLIKFKYDVGKSLLKELESEELERYIFVLAELLNPHAIEEVRLLKDSEKTILAHLNLSAALRSSKLSAFASASKFAKIGISMLPDGHWETHRKLSLNLFSVATESEGLQMNEDEMKKYGSEVLQRKCVALLDKIRIYRAYLSFLGLGKQMRSNEAVELCLDVLDQLGCHFPKTEFVRTIKLISNLMKHKRELSKRTPEEVASLPILSSRRLRVIDIILYEMSISAYFAGRTTLSALCAMKQTSITLKHGIHDASHVGFSTMVSFFMVAFDDLEATRRLAQYARFLKERAHGDRNVSGFCMVQGTLCLPWTYPWSTTMKTLREGYDCGMRDGEFRNAIYCISTYLHVALYASVPLYTLRKNITMYLRHNTELNTVTPLTSIMMLQRATDLLFGIGASDTADDHVLIEAYEDTVKDDEYMMAMLYVFQGLVHHAWGDHVKGLSLVLKTGTLLDKLVSHSAKMPGLYHQCFALYASAQKSSNLKRRRLKRLGLKRHNILRRWAKDGCCNVVHYVAILDAELAVLNRAKQETVHALYQKGIRLAVRGGLIQDAAVGNERLALYFQGLGDTVEARRRFEQAIRYYDDWGFTAKAKLLHEMTQQSILI